MLIIETGEYSGSTEPPVSLDESHFSGKIELSVPIPRSNEVYYPT